MYEWTLKITDLNVSDFTIFIFGIWPTLMFFFLLFYLKVVSAKPRIIKLVYIYILCGGMPPLFWGIISCLLHPNYWLYLIPLIVAVIFGLIIWPGFLPRTIILLYPKDKNKYDDIFSIDNSNIETIYPGNIQTVRFVAMCYVSIIVLLPIMGGVLSCLPYAGPIMGGLYATITYGPLFFAFLFRWLLRCPVCHLALFDIANDVNINTFNLFKNAWFALFSRKLKCCNCKANFILRKVNKDL